MENLWRAISSEDYDRHMGHENVFQLQIQREIMKEQFETILDIERSNSTSAILGITNGNGLELVEELNLGRVIGIDISKNFLNTCSKRYEYLANRLILHQIDLANDKKSAVEVLNMTKLIIANIVIEHIHLNNFTSIAKGLNDDKRRISCVIQFNPDGSLVSSSGYEYTFEKILPMVEELNENDIIESMKTIGYKLIFKKDYALPNEKIFIRLDFERN